MFTRRDRNEPTPLNLLGFMHLPSFIRLRQVKYVRCLQERQNGGLQAAACG